MWWALASAMCAFRTWCRLFGRITLSLTVLSRASVFVAYSTMPDCPVVGSGSLASGITSDVIGFRPVRNLRVHLVRGQSAAHSAAVRGRFVSREIVPNVYVGGILSGYRAPIVQPDTSIDAGIVGVDAAAIMRRQVGLHVVGVIVAGVGCQFGVGGVPG